MPSTAIDFDQLDRVEPGDELHVRFKFEATEDLLYVIGMSREGALRLRSRDDLDLIEMVMGTTDWGDDNNRNMVLVAGPQWDRSIFEGPMRLALESLEVKPKS